MQTNYWGKANRRGFTLIELLVVIGIILLLAAIMTPVLQKALMKGRMTQTLNNGRQIYTGVVAAHLGQRGIFPVTQGTNAFDNSTDYWKWVIDNRIIDTDFSMFTAHGLSVYRGIDLDKFTADANAWCIAGDVNDSTRNMTPLFFTRNLSLNSLADPVDNALSDEAPFGKNGAVVVKYAGETAIYDQAALIEAFNPASATNTVLRP